MITNATDYVSENTLVSHPGHYQSDEGIECIDAIRAMLGREGFIAYCRGSALKYLWRYGSKQSNTALQDLQKARQFQAFAEAAEQEKE